jgi:uncharacterized membrane protein
MKKPSMKSILWLKDELPVWREEKIISIEQSDAIWSRYSPLMEERGVSGKLVTAFLIIGSLVLAAGILLFIASNWRLIPGWVKLVVTYGCIAASNFFGFELTYIKKNYPILGESLFFLGSILFGAGIWVTAQVFHINAHYTDGVLFWFIGIIPVAWFLRSTPILVLSSIVLSGWALWENIAFKNPVIPYPFIMLVLVFPLAYLLKSKLSLFVSITGMLLWTGFGLLGEYFRGIFHDAEFFIHFAGIYVPIAVLVYSLGIIHAFLEKTKTFETIFKLYSVLILFVLAYIFGFNGIYEWLDTHTTAILFHLPFWVAFGASIAGVAASLVLLLLKKRIDADFGITIGESAACLAVAFFPFMLVNPLTVVSANILLFGLSIGFVFIGYRKRKKLYVNTGFAFFGISFITRYIDIGWMYADRAVFFIIAGILVIGGGIALERVRRRFIKRMESKRGNGEI